MIQLPHGLLQGYDVLRTVYRHARVVKDGAVAGSECMPAFCVDGRGLSDPNGFVMPTKSQTSLGSVVSCFRRGGRDGCSPKYRRTDGEDL